MPASSVQQSTLVENASALLLSRTATYFGQICVFRVGQRRGARTTKTVACRNVTVVSTKSPVGGRISRVGELRELQVCLEKDTSTLFWGRGIAIAAESGPEHREAEAPACLSFDVADRMPLCFAPSGA